MGRLWFARGALVCALGGFGVAADVPRIEVEAVNGFEVSFVDVGRGNTIGVSFNTNFGTLSDHHQMMGRAHLGEHEMFTGTELLPGYHTFEKSLRRAGVSWNAHTGDGNTYYYAFGKDGLAENIISTQLSMLGGLEWDRVVYHLERDVVINEIAFEINHKETHVADIASLALLMPEGHPWRHARLGDEPSLRALTIDHLKEFYYRAYAPDQVKVAILGNFSDPSFKAAVRAWTAKYLKAADVAADPHGYVLGSTPPPRSDVPSLVTGARRLLVQTELVNSGRIVFEVDRADVDADALESLISYLNVPVQGGLAHHLKNELGLVLGSGFGYQSFPNKIHVSFGYTPSRRGLDQRARIEGLAMAAIRDAAAGIDADTLSRIKRSTDRTLKRAGRTVASFIQTMESVLVDGRTLPEQLRAYADVTPERIAAAARVLQPDRAIYYETGPAVTGGFVHPVYGRRMRIDGNRKRVRTLREIANAEPRLRPAPTFPRVLLPARPDGTYQSQFRQTKPDHRIDSRVTLDFRRDLPDRAAMVQFEVSPRHRSDVVALDLTLAAFRDRYDGELSDLRDRYQLQLGLDRSGYVLSVSAVGESEYVAKAAEWILEKLAAFRPTDLELELARESAVTSRKQSYASAFSANLAVGDARTLVDRVSMPVTEAIATTENSSADDVRRIWDRTVAAGSTTIGMVGDFTGADYDALARAAHAVLPVGLDAAARGRNEVIKPWVPTEWIKQTTRARKPFALPKSDGYGQVRIYRGPPIGDLEESMAFQALNAVLAPEVSNAVRGDEGLGYVHTTTAQSFDEKYSYLTFYGQVDAPEKTLAVERGWESVLESVRTGRIGDRDIEVGVAKLLNELGAERVTAGQFLYSYMLGQRTRLDARVRDRMVQILSTMTPARVREVAQKYVLDPGAIYAQTTYGDCEKLLALGPP